MGLLGSVAGFFTGAKARRESKRLTRKKQAHLDDLLVLSRMRSNLATTALNEQLFSKGLEGSPIADTARRQLELSIKSEQDGIQIASDELDVAALEKKAAEVQGAIDAILGGASAVAGAALAASGNPAAGSAVSALGQGAGGAIQRTQGLTGVPQGTGAASAVGAGGVLQTAGQTGPAAQVISVKQDPNITADPFATQFRTGGTTGQPQQSQTRQILANLLSGGGLV